MQIDTEIWYASGGRALEWWKRDKRISAQGHSVRAGEEKKTASLYIGAWICFAADAFCSLNWIRRFGLDLHLDWGFSSVLIVGISTELPQRPFISYFQFSGLKKITRVICLNKYQFVICKETYN